MTRRKPWSRPKPLGLRATVTVSFSAGALLLSTLLAAGTYLVARNYLVDQRERTATRQAFADASYVRDGLLTAGAQVSDVLGAASAPADSDIVLHRGNRWFSSSLAVGADDVPEGVRDDVGDGAAAVAWSRTSVGPVLVVGVALPAVEAQFYEIATTAVLDRTLATLRAVLTTFAVFTTLCGAVLGLLASRRLLLPLDAVAAATARIAGGELTTRLPTTDDPDLATIVGSFNAMVEALDERIQKDARFAADLGHELRSPLTTLSASVDLLQRRRDELPERSRRALDLVAVEIERFRRTVEDLLELGRLDAGVATRVLSTVDVGDLVAHALEASGRSADVLTRGAPLMVDVDKQQLNRALVNLFDNADRHGNGLTAVRVHRAVGYALIVVDDDGPGVGPEDRERVFERFARGGSRGSRPGTGLGLSLVAESVRAHGGDVWCSDSPTGGARFTVRLPVSPVGPDDPDGRAVA